jgi:hypothetical protein
MVEDGLQELGGSPRSSSPGLHGVRGEGGYTDLSSSGPSYTREAE